MQWPAWNIWGKEIAYPHGLECLCTQYLTAAAIEYKDRKNGGKVWCPKHNAMQHVEMAGDKGVLMDSTAVTSAAIPTLSAKEASNHVASRKSSFRSVRTNFQEGMQEMERNPAMSKAQVNKQKAFWAKVWMEEPKRFEEIWAQPGEITLEQREQLARFK